MKKLMTLAVLAALGAAYAQENVVTIQNNPEVLTLPGGTQVSVENNTTVRILETKKVEPERLIRKMAIFTRNSTGKDITDGAETKIMDLVLGMVPDGFEIIDPRNAVFAMNALPDAIKTADGVDQARAVEYLQAQLNRLQGNNAQKNLGGSGTTADERLLAQTSITRLAQNMDADYIMLLTLIDVEFVDPVEDAPGQWTHISTMDASYQIMDSLGASIGRGALDARLMEQKTSKQLAKTMPAQLNRSMAKKLAADMEKNADKWRKASLIGTRVPVTFDAQAMTMDKQPMYIYRVDLENKVVNDAQVPVRVAALVDVDGVTVGTTDCEVLLTPGMHKVRVWRQGMDDVNMTINAKEGLVVNVPMRITEGEMKRIQELQAFIHLMSSQEKITDAQAEKIRGEAEMLRNSHIRIDATNLPDTHILYAPNITPAANINVINNTNAVK